MLKIKRAIGFLMLAAAVCWLAGAALAAVPAKISYEGRLLDSGGNPVTTGKSVIFTIYDAESSGNLLWTSPTYTVTPDANGVFTTIMSAGSPTLDSSIFTAEARHLNVNIAGENVAPRAQFVTVPFAFRAAVAESMPPITIKDGNVGIGITAPGATLEVRGKMKIWDNSSNRNIFVNGGILPCTADDNIAIGNSALSKTTGNYNIAIGTGTLQQNLAGADNVAIGYNTMSINETGARNTALGEAAGANNTIGNNNVYLGYNAGGSSDNSGNVCIGYNAGANNILDNRLYIANSSTNPPLIYGNFTAGNVGIGTTNTLSKLCVNGGVAVGSYAGANAAPSNGLIVSGNVGIGTPEPQYILDVWHASSKVNSKNGYLTNGADYAEYFENEENIPAGALVGIDMATGKARVYREGDEFVGIATTAASAGYIGNSTKEKETDPGQTLVGLLGQLDLNRAAAKITGRLVYTPDGKKVGVLLSNNRVLVGR